MVQQGKSIHLLGRMSSPVHVNDRSDSVLHSPPKPIQPTGSRLVSNFTSEIYTLIKPVLALSRAYLR